jgi:hypothetical protein
VQRRAERHPVDVHGVSGVVRAVAGVSFHRLPEASYHRLAASAR